MEEKEFYKQKIIEMIMKIDDFDLIEYINEYITLLIKEAGE